MEQTLEKLTLKYVPVQWAYDQLFERNPKKHDIGAICDSIKKYGFKDPPKFEPALNKGKGGVADGNGRVEALAMLEKAWDAKGEKLPCPRGIVLEKDSGVWAMPMLFGVDSESEAIATAYAIDANNLTLMGGEFTALDASRMWEGEEYLEILQELADLQELPVSLDEEDLDLLGEMLEVHQEDGDRPLKPEREINCKCPACGHEFVKTV